MRLLIVVLALVAGAGMASADGSTAATEGTPLSDLGYPQCPDIIVPDASVENRGGGRSLRDYVEICTSAGEQGHSGGGGGADGVRLDGGGLFLMGTAVAIGGLMIGSMRVVRPEP